jgi:SAM-dependent methyltransferase
MAARRAFSGFGADIAWVCGDARFLPFKAKAFRCAFSYSVIQHFSEADAQLAIAEIGRVLRRDGFAKIQMAHKGGLRSIYARTRADYLDGGSFRVRYWSLAAMREVFAKDIGPTRLSAEAFGGLGLLGEDRSFVPLKVKVLISISMMLKTLAKAVPALIKFADSVYVVATKREQCRPVARSPSTD